MYETVVGAGAGLIASYGLGILLLVFALEGALIGKLVPTRVLFVGAVLALGTDTIGLVSVFLAAVVGATAGQLVIFTLVRRTSVPLGAIPGRGGPSRDGRLQGWFDRWGLPAIAVSNFIPVVRGSLTVPAAMTDASLFRFSSAAVVGTSVYAGGLIAIAVGIEVVLSEFLLSIL